VSMISWCKEGCPRRNRRHCDDTSCVQEKRGTPSRKKKGEEESRETQPRVGSRKGYAMVDMKEKGEKEIFLPDRAGRSPRSTTSPGGESYMRGKRTTSPRTGENETLGIKEEGESSSEREKPLPSQV